MALLSRAVAMADFAGIPRTNRGSAWLLAQSYQSILTIYPMGGRESIGNGKFVGRINAALP